MLTPPFWNPSIPRRSIPAHPLRGPRPLLPPRPTWMPAASKRSRSHSTFGLWQVLSASATPRDDSTALQSPTFAV